MFALSCPNRLHKGFPTLCAVVLFDLRKNTVRKAKVKKSNQNPYPVVAFHVNDQRRLLSECLRTQATLELLDVEVDLPMVLQSL